MVVSFGFVIEGYDVFHHFWVGIPVGGLQKVCG